MSTKQFDKYPEQEEEGNLRSAIEALLPMFDNDSPLFFVYQKEIAALRAALPEIFNER